MLPHAEESSRFFQRMDGDFHKVAARPKSEELETPYGWSPDRARGYVDGVACRMGGNGPSKYMLVGIDEYALGFRAGYYNR